MTDPHGDLELIDLESPAEEAGGRQRPRRDRPDSGPSAATRRWIPGARVATVLALLVVLLAWGLWAYSGLRSVRDDLLAARGELDGAVSAVGDGDLGRASELLQRASETFATVPERVNGPRVAPARLLPRLRRTLDAVETMSTAAGSVASAGVEVAQTLGAEGEGLGGLAPSDGRIPVETFAALAPTLVEVEEDIDQALARVTEVPRVGIDPSVRDARDTFLEQLEPMAAQITRVRQAAAIVPGLFGADGPRRYMVVASNPTEARGSGGFFGAYTIMEADDGVLSFSEVRPTQDLPVLPRGQIPWPDPSLEERYDDYGGSGFILNLNMTPDFPSAATALENYYLAATGEALDGVVAADPFAFQALLDVAGPVEVPGYGMVGPEEVVEFVSHGAYSVITDPEERKRLIGLVATAALQGFLDSPEDVSAGTILAALGEMIDRQSLLVHAADEDAQSLLESLGIAGALGGGQDASGDLLAVHLNSGAAYKVDYWLQRHLRYDVVLAPGGSTASTLSTGFVNSAPTTGEPIYMVGNGLPPLDVGDSLSFVSVYCRSGCQFFEIPDSGFDELLTEEGRELGFGVSSTWMRLSAGQASELVWSYTTPDGWAVEGLDRVYRLHYDHQTTILPTQLQIGVEIPEGFEVAAAPEGSSVEGGRVTLSREAVRDVDLTFRFSPARSPGE